ncbi:MAG TPA: type II CAAX endopeptidase family protein [Opitutaceae bacterium]|jgi:hypothetical protein|nr:type II CAAX endopeptidase family protein [Opitutaceae bacterium]
MSARQHLGYAIFALIIAGGIAILAREAWRSRRQRPAGPSPLAPWPGRLPDLMLFLLCAFCGAFLLPSLGAAAFRPFLHTAEQRFVFGAVFLHVGFLLGIAGHHLAFRLERWRAPEIGLALRTGGAAVLAAWPLLLLTALIWENLLQACGLPPVKQDQVAIFEGINSPALRAVFALFAGVIAPINEELIFRAGLFRFCRGRLPRWLALLLPALLFGLSHYTGSVGGWLTSLAPLVVLGLVFELAYERTGRIGTAIVAHALYNIATMALILLGIDL